MISGFSNRYPIIVLYAIALHFIQAIALAFDPSVAGVTSVATALELIGDRKATSELFVLVAFLAGAGLMVPGRTAAVWLMVPQQVLLVVGMIGAIAAISARKFADGIERPFWFLFADQAPIILATIGHSIAMISVLRGKTSWTRGSSSWPH